MLVTDCGCSQGLVLVINTSLPQSARLPLYWLKAKSKRPRPTNEVSGSKYVTSKHFCFHLDSFQREGTT